MVNEPLVFRELLQGHVFRPGLLVEEHGVAVGESSAGAILAGDADLVSAHQDAGVGECFGEAPNPPGSSSSAMRRRSSISFSTWRWRRKSSGFTASLRASTRRFAKGIEV